MVDAVGIADGDGGYAAAAVEHAAASVAYGGAGVPFIDGYDHGAEGGDLSQRGFGAVAQGGHTIQSKPRTHQIVLVLRVTDYACRVEHMTFYAAFGKRLDYGA